MLYEPGSDQQHDGLLGENLLRHYRAIVDCGRLALYLNTDPARQNAGPRPCPDVAPVGRGFAMEDFGNDFAVPCTLDGHHFRVVVVDTGAPFTILDKDRLRIVEMQAAELPVRSALIGTHGGNIGLLKIDGISRSATTPPRTSQAITKGEVRRGGSGLERKQTASPNAPMLGLLGGNFSGAQQRDHRRGRPRPLPQTRRGGGNRFAGAVNSGACDLSPWKPSGGPSRWR